MKITAGLALVGALVAGPAMAASAAQIDAVGFGATSGGAPAVAGTQERSTNADTRAGNGSNWQWGVIGGRTFSNYFQEGKCHGSTAIGQKTVKVTNIGAGKWSYANAPQRASGNQAFYHVC